MHLLVGNPTAQSGRNAGRIDVARLLLTKEGIDHDFLATRPEGKTVGDVARALEGGTYSTVISMGGDGTFSEVGNGILRSGADVALAMLPTGTANDQGKSFGLDSRDVDLPRNVRVIAEGHTAPLDAGRIVGYGSLDEELARGHFFDSAGWGFSALVLRMRNEDRRLVGGVPILRELYRDHAGYAGAILRALALSTFTEQPFEAEVTTAEGTIFLEGLTELILKNTRIYAGAWILDPTCSPEDGEMELVPFRGREELLTRGVIHHQHVPLDESPLHALGRPLSASIRAPWFDIRLRPRPLAQAPESQLDGEEWQRAERFHITVLRHALRLVVPASLDAPA